MSIATNAQMQAFADQRVRVRAEQLRAVKIACAEDKLQIDDIYARATQNPGVQWNDARVDGPPHLLQSGFNGSTPSNPDDMTNYNAFLDLLAKFFAGNFATLAEANSAAAMWVVLDRACVRPIGT